VLPRAREGEQDEGGRGTTVRQMAATEGADKDELAAPSVCARLDQQGEGSRRAPGRPPSCAAWRGMRQRLTREAHTSG